MANLQLGFHGTFQFKKEEIAKIIHTATEENGLNDTIKNLMVRTGFGNAKITPLKSWATHAGLLKNNQLTPEGNLIYKLDPYLQSFNTDWLMHFYFSFGDQGLNKVPNKSYEWGGWTYFVYDFIPNNLSFSTEYLHRNIASIFSEESSKSIKDNFSKVLKTYTESHGLKTIQFIQKIKDAQTKIITYQTGESIPPNIYLIGYFLARLWERDFEQETSVLTDEILYHKMGLTQVLGITSDTLQDHLNQLESLGIIEQRRTVAPYQTIRRWDAPLILLEKAYVNQ
ncbi:hypothetical protein Cyast_2598 [Cyanobacterium stanieri PCC 7202]|uniref:DUF4007 domain-containing protein n=1 Tax=Cyanobacterium stanieri (strain ATCC 29140 / PCC 7202) TaxID=292563 RepID=K9YNL7_CYASC|nr:hypothetical protein Cyast_2598 [Cyanobacterium stanieri PCC 7202]